MNTTDGATTEIAPESRDSGASLASLPSGTLPKQVLVLALPMLGEQFLNFLVGFVDTFLAGHISKEASSAVGTGSYMGWLMTLAFTLVGVGAAALISRAFGARDSRTADRAMNQAVVMALVVGLAAALGGFFGAPVLIGFLGLEPAAEALGIQFMRTLAPCYVLASINMVGGAALRAAGDPRTPLSIMTVVNVVNIVVSATLVYGWFGPKLGVEGIAIGALLARSTGGLIMLVVLVRGVRSMRVQQSLLAPDLGMIWRMLRIGLPTAAEAAIMAVSQLLFIRIIAHTALGAAGTANYAAHMIAMQIEAISYLPAFAWGTAAATLCGQYLGANRPDLATRAGHVTALQGLIPACLCGTVFFLLSDVIFGLMTADPEVQRVGAPAFRLLAFVQPFLATAIIYMTALRGAGDTRWPMVFTLLCALGLRVPIAYLGGVVLGGGLVGAWCGMWSDNIARFALAMGRFRQGNWKRVRV